MKILKTGSKKDFIFVKLHAFCEKRGVVIKYTEPYIHKKNCFAKHGFKTIINMKNLMFIDSSFFNDLLIKTIKAAGYLHTKLFTKPENNSVMIPEKLKTDKSQDFRQIWIFASLILAHI